MEKISKDHFDNPVVVILLLILIGIGGYFLFSSGNQNKIIPEGNNMYYFTKGSFAAYFPEEPSFKTDSQDLSENSNASLSYQNNSVLDNIYYVADTQENIEFEITYINSAFKNSDTPEDNLKNEIAYTGNSNGGRLISSKATTYNGLPAVDYVVCSTTNQRCSTGRDILQGNNLYMLNYYYNSGEEDKILEKSFLNSILFGNESSMASQREQSQINALKSQIATLQNAKPKSDSLSSDSIQKWKNLSAYVECSFSNENLISTATGSGFIQLFTNVNSGAVTPKIITNKHVVTDIQGYTADYCNFYMYGGHSYSVSYTDFQLGSGDWAYIPITSDAYSSSVSYKKSCDDNSASLGDKITIFGYPTDGSHSGVTVTTGVVSGDEGNYYVTDAKIDHGNSGGVAVLNKDDCYLGIPTWAQSGGFESFGRILKASFVLPN